jgi:cytochrome o ubiquinol oxidase subunit 3
MSTADSTVRFSGPYRLGLRAPNLARGHGGGGPATKRVIVGYGFWLFLLSDIVIFSCLFATYAVLAPATAGGPAARDIFDLNRVALETACLLASSFFCGLATIAAAKRSQVLAQAALMVTGLLGLAFILLEASEFSALYAQGYGPTRSAFLTGFFSLVGCHGLHVTAGLLWLGTMMAQFFAKGFRPDIGRRFLCFSMFWHFLDIIWVAIFSLVYLVGVHL